MPNDPDYPKLYGLHNTGRSGGVLDADVDALWDVLCLGGGRIYGGPYLGDPVRHEF